MWRLQIQETDMSKKKTDTETEIRTTPLRGLFDKMLSVLEKEIENLPETLQGVTPDKRLDFISKNLPLLLKYRETGQGDTWTQVWGD